MNPSIAFLLRPLLLLSVVFSIAAPQSVQAQQNLNEFQQEALTALRAGQWEQSLQLTTQAIETFGTRGKRLWGDGFGWFYYMQGFSYVKLRQYEPAMAAFQTCYEDFPNNPPKDKNDPNAGKRNVNRNKALLRWAEAAVLSKEYDVAIKQYHEFLKVRQPDDKFNRGKVNLDLAIANLSKAEPDAKKGIELLENSIRRKKEWGTPDSALMTGVTALIRYAIGAGKQDLLVNFITRNRADILLPPAVRVRYANTFMQQGAAALNANLDRAAFMLYGLVPSTQAAIADIEARLDAFSPRTRIKDGGNVFQRRALEKQLKGLKARLSAGNPFEATALAATAVIHERMGNLSAAFAANEQLESFYPKNERREQNLYNLVRHSSATSQIFKTEEYGQRFLKAFPDSDFVPTVERLMLTSLFFSGEFAKCIKLASVMIDQVEEKTERHDVILHVLGGSYYYEGRPYDAEPFLTKHPQLYPESKYAMSAQFFEASNAARLRDFDRASRLLGKFLEAHPDPNTNPFLPNALYDRATVLFAGDEFEKSLSDLDRISSKFSDAAVIDIAFNLRGNVLQNMEKPGEAEEAYKKALEIAERRGNQLVAGDSLNYLVGLLSDIDDRTEDSLAYYDKFWAEYADDSPLRPAVANAGLAPMIKHDRGDEGLEKMRTVISNMARTADSKSMERIINSYTDAYLESGKSVEELKNHYYNFPEIDNEDKATQALLRIALVGVYEKDLASAGEDKAKARTAQASIKTLFADLRTSFPPKILSNFILVRLGDYLRTNTSLPAEGIPYYREAISREDTSFRNEALFGLADVLGQSADTTKRQEGLEILDKIYANAENGKELREKALFRIVEVNYLAKDWAEAEKRGLAYLNSELNLTRSAPKVGLMYADAIYEQGRKADAANAYTKTFGANIGNVSVAAPSVIRMAEIAWERNQGEDRQNAYDTIAGWVKNLERSIPKFQPRDKERYENVAKLAKQYEESGQIKTLAQQEAEKEDN